MNMKNCYLMINIFLILLGIIFCMGALKYGLRIPSPGFFPFVLGIIFIFLSVLILITTLKKRKDKTIATERFFPGNDSWKKLFVSLFALFVYVLALEYLGFLLAAFLFMVVELRFIEPQKWKTIITAAFLTAASCYALFDLLLKAQLPKGILGM